MLEDIESYTDYEIELLDTLTRQHEELTQLKALRDAEHAPAGAESARTDPARTIAGLGGKDTKAMPYE